MLWNRIKISSVSSEALVLFKLIRSVPGSQTEWPPPTRDGKRTDPGKEVGMAGERLKTEGERKN